MSTRSISVDFGVAQTGIGYQLKDASGSNVGSRVTSGITHIAGGVYLASADDAGAVGVYWDCAATGVNATEMFEPLPLTAIQIADAILDRDMNAVSDTNSRSPLNALRFIRNGFSIAGTTLTVLKENDTTPAYTRVLTTDPSALPISGVS